MDSFSFSLAARIRELARRGALSVGAEVTDGVAWDVLLARVVDDELSVGCEGMLSIRFRPPST